MKKMAATFALISLTAGSAFANSYKMDCRLIGAHMSPTVMLTMNLNSDTEAMEITERGVDSESILQVQSSKIQSGYARKGQMDVLTSKSSKMKYVITVLKDTEDLGTWQSKPVEDHCAPYEDMSTSTTQLQISMMKGSKVLSQKNVSMVCESSGGYHGYYGQTGCEIDEN